jgi:ATP-dependent RNA helicase MSS116, mitochondrial
MSPFLTLRHTRVLIFFRMDYPDVTFVLQVGLTDRAQYIHRLGRTARAGKEGKGTLLLADYEERHMRKELSDMPLEAVAVPTNPATASRVAAAIAAVSKDKDLTVAGQQAYGAWLGYYKGNLKKCGFSTTTLVQTANQWAKIIGLAEQPKLQRKTVGMMGLKGVPQQRSTPSRGPPRGAPRTNRNPQR